MRLLDLLSDPIRLPILLAFVGAVLRVAYAIISHVVAPYPRLRAGVEAVVALMPDTLRSGLQVVSMWTGRPAPTLDVRPADPTAARVTAQVFAELDATKAERDALARRVAEFTAAEEPGRLRPTVVPGEEPLPPRSPDESTHAATTSRHRIAGTRGAV